MTQHLKKVVQIDDHTINYEYNLLDNRMVLKYDDRKCVACQFCHLVCPVTNYKGKALKLTAIGTPEQMRIPSKHRIVVNVDNCVFCGCCSWICPGYTLELLVNGQKKLILVENKALPEFEEEVRTLENGEKVRKVVQGSITIDCTSSDAVLIDSFAKECAVSALSRKGNSIEIDKDKCLLCFKCSNAAAEKYPSIKVKVHRDRFKNVKGEPSSVWNKIMERVLGKEGKIKGMQHLSQNKLENSILRLMGIETEEESK